MLQLMACGHNVVPLEKCLLVAVRVLYILTLLGCSLGSDCIERAHHTYTLIA